MNKTRNRPSAGGSLSFPNPSRSYDETRHGVSFWGYDRTFEVSFFVEEGALLKVNPEASIDESGLLDTFDTNLDHIRTVAGNLFSQHRKSPYIFSYTLTDSDF